MKPHGVADAVCIVLYYLDAHVSLPLADYLLEILPEIRTQSAFSIGAKQEGKRCGTDTEYILRPLTFVLSDVSINRLLGRSLNYSS